MKVKHENQKNHAAGGGRGREGVDSITACIDLDESDACEDGEPQAFVTKHWLENFVTGGGKISFQKGNGKKTEWTFGGTVGVDDTLGVVGQFQIVHHGNSTLACHFSTFTFLGFSNGAAESPQASHNTADFDASGSCDDESTANIQVIIQDQGEPGKDTDKIKITGDHLIPGPTNGPVT